MKLIIETQDIETVKRSANERRDVILTDEQAKKLIEDHGNLATELYTGEGYLDTVGEEMLSDAIVDLISPNLPPPPKGRCGWDWPTYGDSKEYQAEFDAAFKQAVLATGLGWSGE